MKNSEIEKIEKKVKNRLIDYLLSNMSEEEQIAAVTQILDDILKEVPVPIYDIDNFKIGKDKDRMLYSEFDLKKTPKQRKKT